MLNWSGVEVDLMKVVETIPSHNYSDKNTHTDCLLIIISALHCIIDTIPWPAA